MYLSLSLSLSLKLGRLEKISIAFLAPISWPAALAISPNVGRLEKTFTFSRQYRDKRHSQHLHSRLCDRLSKDFSPRDSSPRDDTEYRFHRMRRFSDCTFRRTLFRRVHFSSLRGHLKSSHMRINERTFIWHFTPSLPPQTKVWSTMGVKYGWWLCPLSSFFPTTCPNNVFCLTQGRFPASIAKWTWKQSCTVEEWYNFYFFSQFFLHAQK